MKGLVFFISNKLFEFISSMVSAATINYVYIIILIPIFIIYGFLLEQFEKVREEV